MKHTYIDFHIVEPRHNYIHAMCCNWTRWVKVRKETGWHMHPMWRNAKSGAWQWHTPEYRETCDIIEAMRVEEAVRKLPHAHRLVLRWAYVFGGDPKGFARKMGMTTQRMYNILCESRTKLEYLLTVHENHDTNALN